MKKLFTLLTIFSSLILAESKPNIIYILADDMGYGDVKAYNPDCKFPTPHLDSLAQNGMMFTDSHTNSSVCTPTRYGIMTGRYAWRTRLKDGVQNGYGASLIEPDRMTLASLLKSQGYNTACIGKWHIGMDWALTSGSSAKAKGDNVDHTTPIKNGPVDVGFDYYFGLAGSLGMPPHCFIENRNLISELDVIHKDKKGTNKKLHSCRPGFASSDFDVFQVLNQVTDKAVDYIEKNAKKEKPFFLYFPLNAPHAPVTPHKDFQAKSNINAYADFCMEVDWRVGQIIKSLKEQNIFDNTLIIFTTDNGCSGTAKIDQLLAVGHNPSAHFRGIKGNLYEGGHRVPFLVQWPKAIKAGSVSDQTICTTDFLATLADMNNLELKDNQGEDSVSFYPALMGQNIDTTQRTAIIHHSDQGKFAIRQNKWVLVMDPHAGSKRKDGFSTPVKNPAAIQLFDLDQDPSQTINLQHQNPEIVSRMKKQLMSIIDNGRSTPGQAQKNDPGKKGWAHYDELIEKIN
ncbi:arylsulfatase [Lentisphaera profundi]|uniref:Arylsulfatase n=1 Tax=Lentisphaera profundi TaxID=1658616 RepID=A0ABY7VRX4_9BACT|nr:arylsulfatase [Lentisphaera profundi]WDE96484.1 arylsulfatase [Lentisphaera profundi]